MSPRRLLKLATACLKKESNRASYWFVASFGSCTIKLLQFLVAEPWSRCGLWIIRENDEWKPKGGNKEQCSLLWLQCPGISFVTGWLGPAFQPVAFDVYSVRLTELSRHYQHIILLLDIRAILCSNCQFTWFTTCLVFLGQSVMACRVLYKMTSLLEMTYRITIRTEKFICLAQHGLCPEILLASGMWRKERNIWFITEVKRCTCLLAERAQVLLIY